MFHVAAQTISDTSSRQRDSEWLANPEMLFYSLRPNKYLALTLILVACPLFYAHFPVMSTSLCLCDEWIRF